MNKLWNCVESSKVSRFWLGISCLLLLLLALLIKSKTDCIVRAYDEATEQLYQPTPLALAPTAARPAPATAPRTSEPNR